MDQEVKDTLEHIEVLLQDILAFLKAQGAKP